MNPLTQPMNAFPFYRVLVCEYQSVVQSTSLISLSVVNSFSKLPCLLGPEIRFDSVSVTGVRM